jgi:hypothetical protein
MKNYGMVRPMGEWMRKDVEGSILAVFKVMLDSSLRD